MGVRACFLIKLYSQNIVNSVILSKVSSLLRMPLREGIWKRLEVVIPPIPLTIVITDLQLFTYQLGIMGHPFLSWRPELGAFVSRVKLFQSANEHQIL